MKLSPREKRALRALINRPIMRENVDAIAGCSNGPDLIAGLRQKGFAVPCERVERFDKDGNICYPGIYSLTEEDKLLAHSLLDESQPHELRGRP